MLQRRVDEDELACELLPAVAGAAAAIIKAHPGADIHEDDLLGEGGLRLAEIIREITCGLRLTKPRGYVFTSAKRRMIDYLRSLPKLTYVAIVPDDRPARVSEAEQVSRLAELRDDLLASCCDDTDRSIVHALTLGRTRAEIAEREGLAASTVGRRVDAIAARHSAKNL